MTKTAVILAIVAAVTLLILWIHPGVRWYPATSLSELKADIETSIPVGTSRETVQSFLGRRKIEYSENDEARELTAIVRDVCVSAILQCDFQVLFEFDRSGELASYSVTEVITSL